MTKSKQSTNTSRVSPDSARKCARFYFILSIDHVVPPNPKDGKQRGMRNKRAVNDWATEYCESLSAEIQTRLSVDYDEVVFKSYERHKIEKNVFTITFVISKVLAIAAKDIFYPRKHYSGFKFRARSLLLTTEQMRLQIQQALCYHYCIVELSLKYLTSRSFVFEIYFEGYFELEHVFTAAEIRDAESITGAIESFSSEVEYAFQHSGFEVSPRRIMRRRKDNRYTFDVYCDRHYAFSEMNVLGELTRLDCEMPLAEAQMFMVEISGDSLRNCIADVQEQFSVALMEELPLNDKVINYEIDCVDYDGEIFDLDDDLIT